MNDAISRYHEARDRFARLDVVSPEVIDLKQRIAKLKCRMGIIQVGGISTLEQTANYDLVDDAVHVTIQTLTTMLLGYLRPRYLYSIERITTPTEEMVELLEDLIPNHIPSFIDYF